MSFLRREWVRTVKVDIEAMEWMAVPDEWPWQGHPDSESWSRFVGETFQQFCGWDDATRVRVEAAMLDLCARQSHSLDDPDDLWFIVAEDGSDVFWLTLTARPAEEPLPLDVACGVGDDATIRTVHAGPFETTDLGTGYRHHRYVDMGREHHDIASIATYAFNARGWGVVIQASAYDVAAVDGSIELLDEFANAVSIVDIKV